MLFDFDPVFDFDLLSYSLSFYIYYYIILFYFIYYIIYYTLYYYIIYYIILLYYIIYHIIIILYYLYIYQALYPFKSDVKELNRVPHSSQAICNPMFLNEAGPFGDKFCASGDLTRD